MILFHKYYIYNIQSNSNFELDNYEVAIIAVTCFFISAKMANKNILLEDLIKICYKYGVLEKKNIKDDRSAIFLYEYKILCINLNNISYYDFSHKNCLDILEKILKSNEIVQKEQYESKNIKEIFFGLIHNSFIFPFFLKYSPKTIVLFCVNSLLRILIPNQSFTIWDKKEYSDYKTDIISFTDLFERIYLSESLNNTVVNNNITSEEEELNFGIIQNVQWTQNINNM